MVAKLHKCQLGHGDIKPFNFLKGSTATPVQAIDLQALVQLNTRECAAWHDITNLQARSDGSQHAPSASGLGMLLKRLSRGKQLMGPVQAQTHKRPGLLSCKMEPIHS